MPVVVDASPDVSTSNKSRRIVKAKRHINQVQTNVDASTSEIENNRSNLSKSTSKNKKFIGQLKEHNNYRTIDETSPPDEIALVSPFDKDQNKAVTPRIVTESNEKRQTRSGKKRKAITYVSDENVKPKKNENLLSVGDSTVGNEKKKRRTYELESTVNSIDDLKTASPFQISNAMIDLTAIETPKKSVMIDLTKSTAKATRRRAVSVIALSPIINNNILKSSQNETTLSNPNDKTKFLHSKISSLDSTFYLENSATDVEVLKNVSRKNLRISVLTSNLKKNLESTEKKVTSVKRPDLKTPLKKIAQISPFFSSSTPYAASSKKERKKTINRTISTPNLPSTTTKTNKIMSTSNLSTNKSGVKTSLVKKMPNFSLIHEKANEKLESISEHKQRKFERAKLLLLGKNPSQEEEKKKSTKRQLRFAPNTIEKEKPKNYIPLPSTPIPKNKNLPPTPPTPPVTRSKAKETPKFQFKLHDATQLNTLEITNPFEVKESDFQIPSTSKDDAANISTKGKKPATPFNFEKKHVTRRKVQIPQDNSPATAKTAKPTTSKFVFKFGNGDGNVFNQKANSPQGETRSPFKIKSKNILPSAPNLPNYNRFGFKNIDRKEAAKAMVTKKVNIRGDPEKREIIKGVRSNRRFDLWMKMRKV